MRSTTLNIFIHIEFQKKKKKKKKESKTKIQQGREVWRGVAVGVGVTTEKETVRLNGLPPESARRETR